MPAFNISRLWPKTLLGRLVVIVLGIDGFAAAMVGGVIVYQARTATVIEVRAAMKVAELLVTDTIGVMKNVDAPLLLQTIDLHSASVRHVRIAVSDLDGKPVQAAITSGPVVKQASFESAPPDWFGWLIGPARDTKAMPVLLRNRLVGSVTVVSAPEDEIGEAWHYARALLEAGFCLSLAILMLALLLFKRVLAPLTALADGLRGLKARNYKVRLPRPALQDLATITDHFNSAAEALDTANAANRRLNRKLVTAQDDERRRTALELHDEVGPYLFALNVDASSMVTLSKGLQDGGRIHERAREVVGLVQRLQGINRRVLDRLRPMGLGRIPLKDCLLKILVDFSGDAPGPAIVHAIGRLQETYGPLVDLTIYRCAQEGLFNAIRHAQASKIDLRIAETADEGKAKRLEVSIKDDGRGLSDVARPGLGLNGMRERVDALGGTFEITSSDKGTALMICVPLDTSDVTAHREPVLS